MNSRQYAVYTVLCSNTVFHFFHHYSHSLLFSFCFSFFGWDCSEQRHLATMSAADDPHEQWGDNVTKCQTLCVLPNFIAAVPLLQFHDKIQMDAERTKYSRQRDPRSRSINVTMEAARLDCCQQIADDEIQIHKRATRSRSRSIGSIWWEADTDGTMTMKQLTTTSWNEIQPDANKIQPDDDSNDTDTAHPTGFWQNMTTTNDNQNITVNLGLMYLLLTSKQAMTTNSWQLLVWSMQPNWTKNNANHTVHAVDCTNSFVEWSFLCVQANYLLFWPVISLHILT